jgi:hypothetical protein
MYKANFKLSTTHPTPHIEYIYTMKAMKATKVMSDGRWRRKCKMCGEVKTAWVEMTVVEEGPAKFVMCETCIQPICIAQPNSTT